MRKFTFMMLLGALLTLFVVSPALATSGRVGTTCTPCHTDGRTNPPKTTEAKKTTTPATSPKTAAAQAPVKKTATSKAVAKKALPAGIISKGAFISQLNTSAPADFGSYDAQAALTWQEAAKYAVVTLGMEKDALALKIVEVNHILADYVDQGKVNDAYRPYVALAVKKGLINGAVVKGSKYFYPAYMAQEIYAKQVFNKVQALASIDPERTTLDFKPVRKTKKNHDFLSMLMGATGATVANTCEMCHPGKTDEVVNTVHYQQMGQTTGVKNHADEMAGMWTRF